MAKRKRKQPEPTPGDAYESPNMGTADLSGPWDEAADAQESPGQPEPTEAKSAPATPHEPLASRDKDKRRPVQSRYFPTKKVELIDDYNTGGVGIQLTYNDPAERPSEEVKQILKTPQGNYAGLKYQHERKQWRKRIGADAEPKTAIAIRLDTERRFEAIGDQMSHEEQLKAERAQGQNPDGNTRS